MDAWSEGDISPKSNLIIPVLLVPIVQKYKNEFRAKRRRKLANKLTAVFLVFVAVLAAAVYLLFFAGLFDIRTVKINETDKHNLDVSSAVSRFLDSRKLGIARRRNILFVQPDQVAAYLTAQFPELLSVSIEKKSRHKMELVVEERQPVGIWCRGPCYYFDHDFVAYAETIPSSGFLVLRVIDDRPGDVRPGERIDSPVWVENILTAREALSLKNLPAAEFRIPKESFDEFHAMTSEGWWILFSHETNIADQIDSLANLLKQKISPETRARLQYIDLRIQDRIYYK